MNRLVQSGIAAGAAALLSGGAALTLSGGASPTTDQVGSLWRPPIVEGAVNRSDIEWAGEARTTTVWSTGAPLATITSNASCRRRKSTAFRFVFPLAKPARLTQGATATLRFVVERRTGWVSGELKARLIGGASADVVAIGDAGPQFVTLRLNPAALKALGKATLLGTLNACSRGGGSGALHLDSVEISA